MDDSHLEALGEALSAGEMVRSRLAESLAWIGPMLPLDAAKIAGLDRAGHVEMDALLMRFSNLVAIVQDQLVRAVLIAEDERVEGRSRLDHRNTAEKLGALPPGLDLVDMIDARNQIAHQYPSRPGRQAEIVNEVAAAARTAVAAFDGLAEYARLRFAPGATSPDPKA